MEALQKMSDPKLTDCPQCEAPALKKQVTAAAFKLKGTGWYETDFKNSGKKPASNDVKSEGKAGAEANKPEVSGSGAAKSESSAPTSAASTKAASGSQ